MRRALAALIAIGTMGAAAAACQNAVNLDVKYTDAGTPEGGDADPSAQTPSSSTAIEKGAELEGCPCDETQGLACCLSSAGPAFCTTDQDRCNSEKGAFYRCFGPDRNSESVCCWHGGGEGAITALAAGCDGGLEACTTNKDCNPGVECKTRECPQKIVLGACGAEPPACPF